MFTINFLVNNSQMSDALPRVCVPSSAFPVSDEFKLITIKNQIHLHFYHSVCVLDMRKSEPFEMMAMHIR